MIFKEGLNTEIKIGKIIEEEDKVYYLIEFDKDGNELDKFEITDLFVPYLNKEFCKLKIEYAKEI